MKSVGGVLFLLDINTSHMVYRIDAFTPDRLLDRLFDPTRGYQGHPETRDPERPDWTGQICAT